MLSSVALANQVLHHSSALPEALYARALYASILAVPKDRVSLAPNYLSDLGIRKSDDPGLYLHQCLQLLGLRSIPLAVPRSVFTEWSRAELSEFEAAGILDGLVNFAGDWGAAEVFANKIFDSSRPITHSRLATFIGAVFAAQKNPLAERAYRLSSEVSEQPADRLMAELRLAAYKIKRMNDLRGGRSSLEQLHKHIFEARSESRIAQADAAAAEGITRNLEALVHVRTGAFTEANESLRRADDLLAARMFVVFTAHEVGRYRAQVIANQIQLDVRTGRIETAVSRARAHVHTVRRVHLESLSEALTIAGFVHYRANQFDAACGYLREAEHRIQREGAPSRLANNRKILAGCLIRKGNLSEARRILRQPLFGGPIDEITDSQKAQIDE